MGRVEALAKATAVLNRVIERRMRKWRAERKEVAVFGPRIEENPGQPYRTLVYRVARDRGGYSLCNVWNLNDTGSRPDGVARKAGEIGDAGSGVDSGNGSGKWSGRGLTAALAKRMGEAREKHPVFAEGEYHALGVIGEEYRELVHAAEHESSERIRDEASTWRGDGPAAVDGEHEEADELMTWSAVSETWLCRRQRLGNNLPCMARTRRTGMLRSIQAGRLPVGFAGSPACGAYVPL